MWAAWGRHHHQPLCAHPDRDRRRLGHRRRRPIAHGGGEGRRHPLGLGLELFRDARGRHQHQPLCAHPDRDRHRLGHRCRRRRAHDGGEIDGTLWAWGQNNLDNWGRHHHQPGRARPRSAPTPTGPPSLRRRSIRTRWRSRPTAPCGPGDRTIRAARGRHHHHRVRPPRSAPTPTGLPSPPAASTRWR